jgi:hypothetical protein
VPSDVVPEETAVEFAKKTINTLNAAGVEHFGVRVHGADGFFTAGYWTGGGPARLTSSLSPRKALNPSSDRENFIGRKLAEHAADTPLIDDDNSTPTEFHSRPSTQPWPGTQRIGLPAVAIDECLGIFLR